MTLNSPKPEIDPVDLAYWTNSYPEYEHPVKEWLFWLKHSSIAVILLEAMFGLGLAYKAIQFSILMADSTIQTDTVKLGVAVHFTVCTLRVLAGFQLHHHAITITDRTPQNYMQLAKFLRLVTILSVFVSCITLWILTAHKKTLSVLLI